MNSLKKEMNGSTTQQNGNTIENDGAYIVGGFNQPILDESKIRWSFTRQLMSKRTDVVNNSTL